MDCSMNEIIFVIQESLEGGFEATAVGYAIFSEADTIDELKIKIREAVGCHFNES